MELGRTKKVLISSLALVAVLAGCDITAKTASPDPATVGERLTFTIDVAFDQGEPGTIVVDDLPDSLRFVSASDGCLFNTEENTVTCEVPNPNGTEPGTATVKIDVTPTECGTFTNTAVIPFPGPAAAEQLSADQQAAEDFLRQLSAEDLAAVQPFDEESVGFTVVGCEQPGPEQQPKTEQQRQQPAGAAPVTQEDEQEVESGDADQSFEISWQEHEARIA